MCQDLDKAATTEMCEETMQALQMFLKSNIKV